MWLDIISKNTPSPSFGERLLDFTNIIVRRTMLFILPQNFTYCNRKELPLLANVSSIYKGEPPKQSVLFVSPKNFTNYKVVYFLNDVGPIVEPEDC